MSDKEILEKSKLLQHLLPGKQCVCVVLLGCRVIHDRCYRSIVSLGDVILADRGFMCQDYASFVMAEVKTPSFTKGKKQLEKKNVDCSGELSAIRIHIERVIGVVKHHSARRSSCLFNI